MMAKDPDNLILKLLREIRETQETHSKDLRSIKKVPGNLSESTTYSLGLSSMANIKSDKIEKRVEDLEKRLKKLEART